MQGYPVQGGNMNCYSRDGGPTMTIKKYCRPETVETIYLRIQNIILMQCSTLKAQFLRLCLGQYRSVLGKCFEGQGE